MAISTPWVLPITLWVLPITLSPVVAPQPRPLGGLLFESLWLWISESVFNPCSQFCF